MALVRLLGAPHALKPGVGLDRKDKTNLGGGPLIGSTH